MHEAVAFHGIGDGLLIVLDDASLPLPSFLTNVHTLVSVKTVSRQSRDFTRAEH